MLGTPSPKWATAEQLLCKQKALSGWGGVEVRLLGQGELSDPRGFLGTRGALSLNAHHPALQPSPREVGERVGNSDQALQTSV